MQITARHCDVPDETRLRATSLMERLVKFEPNLQSAELVFEEERMGYGVEGILSIARAEPVVARGEGRDFTAAADELSDKLAKILRRRRSQRRDRARSSTVEVLED
ncbi:MAG: HPF/RaiA family ribosome-associated protein [Gemmatimonadota bacterium]